MPTVTIHGWQCTIMDRLQGRCNSLLSAHPSVCFPPKLLTAEATVLHSEPNLAATPYNGCSGSSFGSKVSAVLYRTTARLTLLGDRVM